MADEMHPRGNAGAPTVPAEERDPDARPTKRPRPSSAPNLATPTLELASDGETTSLLLALQQVEFLRQENAALREQLRNLHGLNNRLIIENQLLRNILWAYVELRRAPPPFPPQSPPRLPQAASSSTSQ